MSDRLTRRQRALLDLLTRRTVAQASRDLGIKPRTVTLFLRNIRSRLQVPTIEDAMRVVGGDPHPFLFVSSREEYVICGLISGLTQKQLAHDMGLTQQGVNYLLHNAMGKTGCETPVKLALAFQKFTDAAIIPGEQGSR